MALTVLAVLRQLIKYELNHGDRPQRHDKLPEILIMSIVTVLIAYY